MLVVKYNCTRCRDKNFLIECACGCREIINSRYKSGMANRLRRFRHGHRLIYTSCNVGSDHGHWKGDDITYKSLHVWLNRNMIKPTLCQICHLVPPVELANVTGMYTRDFKNWKYLCIRCHRIFDLWTDMSLRQCSVCNSNDTYIRKSDGRPKWYSMDDDFLCGKCYRRYRYNMFKSSSSPRTLDY